MNLPDIKGDGHHGVEDDDVTPEAEETPVGGTLVAAVVQVPGFGADLLVPEGMTDGQTCCYQDQQRKDLHQIVEEEECFTNSKEKTKISTNQRMFTTAGGHFLPPSHSELSEAENDADSPCKPCNSSARRFWSS